MVTNAPDSAYKLAEVAMRNGWAVLFRPGRDTGMNEFVTVEGSREKDATPQYFSITWHTRDFGTFRIFGPPQLGKWKHNARKSTFTEIFATVTDQPIEGVPQP